MSGGVRQRSQQQLDPDLQPLSAFLGDDGTLNSHLGPPGVSTGYAMTGAGAVPTATMYDFPGSSMQPGNPYFTSNPTAGVGYDPRYTMIHTFDNSNPAAFTQGNVRNNASNQNDTSIEALTLELSQLFHDYIPNRVYPKYDSKPGRPLYNVMFVVIGACFTSPKEITDATIIAMANRLLTYAETSGKSSPIRLFTPADLAHFKRAYGFTNRTLDAWVDFLRLMWSEQLRQIEWLLNGLSKGFRHGADPKQGLKLEFYCDDSCRGSFSSKNLAKEDVEISRTSTEIQNLYNVFIDLIAEAGQCDVLRPPKLGDAGRWDNKTDSWSNSPDKRRVDARPRRAANARPKYDFHHNKMPNFPPVLLGLSSSRIFPIASQRAELFVHDLTAQQKQEIIESLNVPPGDAHQTAHTGSGGHRFVHSSQQTSGPGSSNAAGPSSAIGTRRRSSSDNSRQHKRRRAASDVSAVASSTTAQQQWPASVIASSVGTGPAALSSARYAHLNGPGGMTAPSMPHQGFQDQQGYWASTGTRLHHGSPLRGGRSRGSGLSQVQDQNQNQNQSQVIEGVSPELGSSPGSRPRSSTLGSAFAAQSGQGGQRTMQIAHDNVPGFEASGTGSISAAGTATMVAPNSIDARMEMGDGKYLDFDQGFGDFELGDMDTL